jgi:5-formyltetrahydrofolate cyclo-ligase
MERTQLSSHSLRNRLKIRRESVTSSHRIIAARRSAKHLRANRIFRHAKHVACYLDQYGEFPTKRLIQLTCHRRKKLYLPLLQASPANSLLFAEYRPGMLMRKNRFGIPEPLPLRQKILQPKQLDLVIMPLVGFDAQGHRLGMGGGYYDRSFGFRLKKRFVRKPFLLGLAFDVQQTESLQAQPWDVPLDGILTESGFRLFRK